MEDVLRNPSVQRIMIELRERKIKGEVKILSESARSAAEAAAALGIEKGQIASSIVFKLPDGRPLLVITSGAHRVDTDLVARELGVEKLNRADADFIKSASGISIGGVSPFGWRDDGTLTNPLPMVLIDLALSAFEVVWAAAGHPHAVFPTTFEELRNQTGARAMTVSLEGD
jgi:prolyl-tRNA editing enzyme YbaK/EbsC (Cys-tRNA(Pro) deacylase)